MYDAGKIIVGLALFVALFTSPFLYNLAIGDQVVAADLGPALSFSKRGKCVMDKTYMRAKHMDLLNTWRDDVVRRQDRFLKNELGEELDWDDLVKDPTGLDILGDYRVQKSLSNTCLKCHDNYPNFCQRCHDSNSVTLFCWDCHQNLVAGVKP